MFSKIYKDFYDAFDAWFERRVAAVISSVNIHFAVCTYFFVTLKIGLSGLNWCKMKEKEKLHFLL